MLSGMPTCGGDSAGREAELPRELKMMEISLEALSDRVTQLFDRLQPAMSQEQEKNCQDPNAKEMREHLRAPMAIRLADYNTKIANITAALSSILGRLEI